MWNVCFCHGASMEETIQKVEALHKKVESMGPINWDRIKAMALVNTLTGDFDHLQSSIQQQVNDPQFTSSTILQCI